MAVNLNTGTGAYSVNNSRIQKFMTAETRADALRMGGWDKFKDLFRADNNKKSTKIAQIYDSIVRAPANDRQPMAMLDRFHALKSMAATPADRAQFRTTYTAPGASPNAPANAWGYAFAIGDTRIHEQADIVDAQGSLARTFEQAMLVKELEHHIDGLPEKFQHSEAGRSIDQRYIEDRVGIMASRNDGGTGDAKRALLESLDDPFFCRGNLERVELPLGGGAMVAVFSGGGESRRLEFNAKADPRDPLMPSGETLKRWLEGVDYTSMRGLIESKAKTVEDNKSVNDFSGLGLEMIKDVYAAAGREVSPMALIGGGGQEELANAMRDVNEASPGSANVAIAKLFNMTVAGFTERDPNFAVRNILGKQFCDANQPFLADARQIAADALRAPAEALEEFQPGGQSVGEIPRVPDLRAPREPADQFLAAHLVNYRKLNLLGTVVGGGARPAGDYLVGATQEEVLAQIRQAGFTTILSIDQGDESQALSAVIRQAGLQHEIGSQYEFPDWEHSPDGLYLGIKKFIEDKARQGERVFIHCGAGNGRTGATLAALAHSDLIDKEKLKATQRGERFDLSDYGRQPRISMSAEFLVLRDENDDLDVGPDGSSIKRERTAYELPYLAAHAVQAVRDAVKDNPLSPGTAVETNEQLLDVMNFAQFLLPPGPPQNHNFA